MKSGRRYRYYVSRRLIDGTVAESPDRQGWRLPAREIERIVTEAVSSFLADRAALATATRESGIGVKHVATLLDAAARWDGEGLGLVERVDLDTDRVVIAVNLSWMSAEAGTVVRHVVPIRIKRRGVEMRLVLEATGGSRQDAKPDAALAKAVVRAHNWFDDLVAGRAASLGAIAKNEGITDRYVGHLLPLAFLAPEIVEAILAGQHPIGLTAEALIKRTDLPLAWSAQKVLLGFG